MESLRVLTPLGAVLFSASSAGNADISLALGKPELPLPGGMSVQQWDVCLLKCFAKELLTDLKFECAWEVPFAKGSPEIGECLDAQSWQNESHLATIGTEDFDTLCQRLPNCGWSENQFPPFPDYGLALHVPRVEQGDTISLHFVVACNALPEPVDRSCWFAVDIDHYLVLKFVRD